ncbi:MAG: type 2 isopentenyl-diphosphate Delta-isomerase [Candidatus Hadarchaeota archaeon]
MGTENRKMEHVRICLEKEVESTYSGLEDVTLIHNALPHLDFQDIDTSLAFFNKKLSAPLLIASMTGGHKSTVEINKNLAVAVEELGIGIGVGSQRAAIENEDLAESFTVVRDNAPHALIYANVGFPQIMEHGIEFVEKAVEMVDADAVAIHLNFLQEIIQPEGEVNARGSARALEQVCKEIKKPVIVKETGAGITKEVALKLKEANVDAIDVGGKGGTSWSGVEIYRTKDDLAREVGRDFWNWGVPTAFCVPEVHQILPTIATGGLRSGLDVAKSLSLGATAGSAALPFLKPATKSPDEVKNELEYFIRGLKIAMFLTGSEKIENLRDIPIFIHGLLKDWLESRDIDVREFSRRR